MNVSVIYNDPTINTVKTKNHILASFILNYEPKSWINFAIQMTESKASLYNNCIKVDEQNITRDPKELTFESSSVFYLAQAGSFMGEKEKFEVCMVSFFSFTILNITINHNNNNY